MSTLCIVATKQTAAYKQWKQQGVQLNLREIQKKRDLEEVKRKNNAIVLIKKTGKYNNLAYLSKEMLYQAT